MPDEYPVHRSFNAVIFDLEDGNFHSDLTGAMNQLVETLNHQFIHAGGKPKGKLGITLEFKMDGGVVEIVSNFTQTLPKPGRQKSIMWATPDGKLTSSNPKQLSLGLREVSAPQAEAKTL